jgi:hypothetical protein
MAAAAAMTRGVISLAEDPMMAALSQVGLQFR